MKGAIVLFLLGALFYPECLEAKTKRPQAKAKRSSLSSKAAWRYFHPTWDFEELTSSSSLPITTDRVHVLAFDPERRVEEEFTVGESVLPYVSFWMRIYGQYSSWMRVIHDSIDPRIVYGHIDFTPLYMRKMSRMTREIAKEKIEAAVLYELKQKLRLVSEQRNTSELDKIRFFLSESHLVAPDSIRAAAGRLRSQTGQRDHFLTALHRAAPYLPHIEGIFRKRQLPIGISRLPLVESSFNDEAHSKAGAFGAWQFMPRTMRAFINERNKELWRDPYLQAEIAAVLLKNNRKALPDWGTTITSYNVGIGRLQKVMRRNGLKKYESLIEMQTPELGFAGRNYYGEFLAALLVEGYKDYFFPYALKQSDSIEAFTTLIPVGTFGCRTP